MTYSYKTHGTCSRRIDFDIDDDNTVHNVHFTGGCNGNLAGISSIVEGMDAEEIGTFVREVRPVIYCGRVISAEQMKLYIDKMSEIINHI